MRASLAAALALLLSPAAALAGDALKVEVVPKALQGQGHPELVIKAEARLERLKLDLRRPDGKRLQETVGPILAGREHRFALKLAGPGKARLVGDLEVELAGGESGRMPLELEVELLTPLELSIERTGVDLAARKLRLEADRDVAKVQVSVMSDVGTPLGTTELPLEGGRAAGTPIEVAWKQSAGTVMRITVQAWDADGFFGAVDLFPWKVEIPHEDIHFATGASTVEAAEAPKLEAALGALNAALIKYGAFAKVGLYVAGHTDTVGDAASNRALSDDRARAIGRWFKAHGVKAPIHYAGFGEDIPFVKTADEVDEAKNRRAEYIVAVEPPHLVNGVRWTPLR